MTRMVLVIWLLSGCSILYPKATLPKTGVQATNERIWIDAYEYQTSHQVNEKVGEATHKDSQGNTVGTTDIRATRTVTQTHVAWQGMQGTTPIDDEDLFGIVDDQDALSQTRDQRQSAIRVNRVGRVSMIVGGVAMIAGLFIPNKSISTITFSGGLLVGGLGWYLALTGAKRMEEHAVPVSRAMGDAEEYNRRLGLSGGSPTNGRTIGLMVGRGF